MAGLSWAWLVRWCEERAGAAGLHRKNRLHMASDSEASHSHAPIDTAAETKALADPAQTSLKQNPPSAWAWLVPNFTVFISSLCIMVVELVAGRLIARYVGSSLYTWTSVIGIVLAGIAAGNYIGGRLADRYRALEALASLFLLSSAACLLIPLLNDRVADLAFLRSREWSLRIAMHVFLVFFLPAAFMGSISPVAAKMALGLSTQTGRTVGSVYSWGAVGGIVGTFLTGYFLIAEMGTVAVLLSVSGILLAMALLFGARSLLPFLWIGVFRSDPGGPRRPLGLGTRHRRKIRRARSSRRVRPSAHRVAILLDTRGRRTRHARCSIDDSRFSRPCLRVDA